MRRKLSRAAILVGVAGINHVVKQTARQNTPFRRAWEHHLLTQLERLEQKATSGAELPFIYVALGDSAAQGLGAARIEEGYVPLVASGVAQASGREVALLNLSLSGATAASVLATQLPQLAGMRIAGRPLKPDLVTLDIGGNDVGVANLELSRFRDVFTEITSWLTTPTVVLDLPTYRPLRKDVVERAALISATIRVIAGSAGLRVAEIEAVSRSLSVPKYMFNYHAPDFFHPNSPWYRVWAEVVLSQVCKEFNWPDVAVDDLPDFPIERL